MKGALPLSPLLGLGGHRQWEGLFLVPPYKGVAPGYPRSLLVSAHKALTRVQVPGQSWAH